MVVQSIQICIRLAVAVMTIILHEQAMPVSGDSGNTDLPKSCTKSQTLVTCTKSDEKTLEKLKRALLVEVVVDFVYLETTASCNCDILKLVRTIKDTDIAVMSSRPCGLKEYEKCGNDVPTVGGVDVSGLVVSPADSKLKWAIRHHVNGLWSKARDMHKPIDRDLVYRAILRSVGDVQEKLTEAVEQKGNGRLIYGGDVPSVLHQQNVVEDKDVKQPVEANLREQLWDMNAEKHEAASKQFAEKIRASLKGLESMDATMSVRGGTKAEDLSQKMVDTAQEASSSPVKNDADLEADLDDELDQIKIFLKKKSKKKARSRRDTRRQQKLLKNITLQVRVGRTLNCSDDMLMTTRDCLSHDSSEIIPIYNVKTNLRVKRREKKLAFIHPYKIFIGGDYTSLFDTVGIDLAVSMEARLPQHKLPVIKNSIPLIKPPPPSETDFRINKPVISPPVQTRVSQLDPVQRALLAEANSEDELDELSDSDVVDRLIAADEERAQDLQNIQQDLNTAFNASGIIDTASINLIPRAHFSPPVAGSVAGVVPAAHATFEEEKRRAREQDHVLKNFIIFIIAVIGIIAIFAVLIIMSMRRTPTKEDMDLFQKHAEAQMMNHEQREAKHMQILNSYDGVTPQSSPSQHYGKWQATLLTQREQQQGLTQSGWEPSQMHMDPPLLGGRHVVTEFDDPSYPPPRTIISEQSRSPNWPYFMKPNYHRSGSPPKAADRYSTRSDFLK